MTSTPRQRRKAINQARILDAAADLIVRVGFEHTSLREIAKQVDYSPAGLYKYFENKLALFQALMQRENQKLVELLHNLPADLSPLDRVLESGLLYIDFSLENQAYLSLMNNLPSGRVSKQQPVPAHSPYLIFFQAVKEWVAAEKLSLDESYGLEEISYATWAQIHGMATLRLSQLKDFEADFRSTNRRSLEFYLNGIRQWGSR